MNIKKELDLYIKNNLEKVQNVSFKKSILNDEVSFDCCYSSLADKDISNYLNNNLDEFNFQKLLFKYIDRTNLTDADIYNKVNIDRRLFSKIRGNDYHPSRDTVILLGFALELNEDEIEDLLKSASYSLPKNNKRDLIIRFCFLNKIYDIMTINNLLDDYRQKTLN